MEGRAGAKVLPGECREGKRSEREEQCYQIRPGGRSWRCFRQRGGIYLFRHPHVCRLRWDGRGGSEDYERLKSLVQGMDADSVDWGVVRSRENFFLRQKLQDLVKKGLNRESKKGGSSKYNL